MLGRIRPREGAERPCLVLVLAVFETTAIVGLPSAQGADARLDGVARLVPVDSLVVDVLSDDASDTNVSKTPFATSELSHLVAALTARGDLLAGLPS